MSIWAEIKKAVNSDLSKPLDTLIKDYLGNSTYGLSALKTLMTGGKIPIVKSVQNGVASISSSNDGTSVTIKNVNPNKCIVILNYRYYIKQEYITDYIDHGLTYILTNTNITFTRAFYSSNTRSFACAWQVIEFY